MDKGNKETQLDTNDISTDMALLPKTTSNSTYCSLYHMYTDTEPPWNDNNVQMNHEYPHKDLNANISCLHEAINRDKLFPCRHMITTLIEDVDVTNLTFKSWSGIIIMWFNVSTL
jgi:hypothetical protein